MIAIDNLKFHFKLHGWRFVGNNVTSSYDTIPLTPPLFVCTQQLCYRNNSVDNRILSLSLFVLLYSIAFICIYEQSFALNNGHNLPPPSQSSSSLLASCFFLLCPPHTTVPYCTKINLVFMILFTYVCTVH